MRGLVPVGLGTEFGCWSLGLCDFFLEHGFKDGGVTALALRIGARVDCKLK